MENETFDPQATSRGEYRSNHTGYSIEGSENFEHDDTGCASNLSGCVDMVVNAQIEHEGWDEGYDY
jgi:hypothetical protein